MAKRTVETKFFTFSQNNSGGRFEHDKEAGIGHFVIVEALNSKDACDRAESIGLYFNGCDTGQDCECCGDRWYEPYGEGSETPNIYNADVSSGVYEAEWLWDVPSYIHYMDGTVKEVIEKKVERKKSRG